MADGLFEFVCLLAWFGGGVQTRTFGFIDHGNGGLILDPHSSPTFQFNVFLFRLFPVAARTSYIQSARYLLHLQVAWSHGLQWATSTHFIG